MAKGQEAKNLVVKKITEAFGEDFIGDYIKDVETTKITRYSTIPLLDAIIEYYKIICKETRCIN